MKAGANTSVVDMTLHILIALTTLRTQATLHAACVTDLPGRFKPVSIAMIVVDIKRKV